MLLPGMAFIFVLFKVKVGLLLLLNQQTEKFVNKQTKINKNNEPDKAQQKQKPRYVRLK